MLVSAVCFIFLHHVLIVIIFFRLDKWRSNSNFDRWTFFWGFTSTFWNCYGLVWTYYSPCYESHYTSKKYRRPCGCHITFQIETYFKGGSWQICLYWYINKLVVQVIFYTEKYFIFEKYNNYFLYSTRKCQHWLWICTSRQTCPSSSRRSWKTSQRRCTP